MRKVFTINCHSEFISASHEIPSSADRVTSCAKGSTAPFVKPVRNDVKRVAFTLAEVLITLTIIGVIAALTIPNLMQKWEDSQTVSGVKEAYSILNNALKLAIQENGPLEEWYTNGNWYFTQEMAKHLKYRKICQANDVTCTSNYGQGTNKCVSFKNLHGIPATGSGIGYIDCWGSTPPKIILNNGMIVAMSVGGRYVTPENRTYEFFDNYIRVDINGYKGPNRYGYDVFFFQLSGAGLQPYFSSDPFGANIRCNFKTATLQHLDGASCSTYIMKHGTVDYKYRDVSAEW